MKESTFVGLKFGVFMGLIWALAFFNIIGPAGIGLGIAMGASFFCFGITMYRNLDQKDEADSQDQK